MTKTFAKELKASDARIKRAIAGLADNHRGRFALRDLFSMARNGVNGLDSCGFDCLITLVKELKAGRRDFLEELKKF